MAAQMDAIELSLFTSRMESVCEEMGAVLRRAALSPNIRDRLDFSCAVFDADGALCAQAAHIPVHLGSMAYAMGDIVRARQWHEGDVLILNDPFLGGTHLPDVTVVSPVFAGERRVGFVANRAHHADIGCESPGSMPVSRRLEEEGLVIPPTLVVDAGKPVADTFETIIGATRSPHQSRGDFAAQLSANRVGVQRLGEMVTRMEAEPYARGLEALDDYARRLAADTLAAIPDGDYSFCDWLDDDGAGQRDLPIRVQIRSRGAHVVVDFEGSAPQAAGNVNCPLSVTAAAVIYVFRCLMPDITPACAGSFADIELRVPEGSMLNARRPAAVAAGNVETSGRVVDAVMGALSRALPDRLAAASHGSMNNLAMGALTPPLWDYYETMGGGMGAGVDGGGLDAVQTHMTNTLNTPVEVLEMNFPLRVHRYAIRRGSGGAGARRGGDGIVRELEFLRETSVTLLTERRRHAPWGLAGGGDGARGENFLDGKPLPPKIQLRAQPGQRLTIASAGGGGWKPAQ